MSGQVRNVLKLSLPYIPSENKKGYYALAKPNGF
jgi:hypothetical protein